MKDSVLNLTDEEIDKYIIPYNKILEKEHPLLWKLKYVGLGFIYNFLRNIIPIKHEDLKNERKR
jgi:hypothetical protein